MDTVINAFNILYVFVHYVYSAWALSNHRQTYEHFVLKLSFWMKNISLPLISIRKVVTWIHRRCVDLAKNSRDISKYLRFRRLSYNYEFLGIA